MLAAISGADIATLVGLGAYAPAIVNNASGSAPLGFYFLDHRLPGWGEVAVVRPPQKLATLMDARGILPAGVPLVKQVAAIGGDEVCRSRELIGTLAVNGNVVAEVQDQDRKGRPLPGWEGCRFQVFRTGVGLRHIGYRPAYVDVGSGLKSLGMFDEEN